MTVTFRCNGCSLNMEENDQRGGLWYTDDRGRRRDLCPKCFDAVDQFIDELGKENDDNNYVEPMTTTDPSLRFRKVNQK